MPRYERRPHETKKWKPTTREHVLNRFSEKYSNPDQLVKMLPFGDIKMDDGEWFRIAGAE